MLSNTCIEELKTLKNKIENLSKSNQIEILKILKNNSSIKLNENKSGVFVNLSFLPKETIHEMDNYINYVNEQEQTLNTLEIQKNEFKTAYFTG